MARRRGSRTLNGRYVQCPVCGKQMWLSGFDMHLAKTHPEHKWQEPRPVPTPKVEQQPQPDTRAAAELPIEARRYGPPASVPETTKEVDPVAEQPKTKPRNPANRSGSPAPAPKKAPAKVNDDDDDPDDDDGDGGDDDEDWELGDD